MSRLRFVVACGMLAALSSGALQAQENPYTYVKMSLTVPWTLYFVFLACVLIPFVLFVLLAWHGHMTKSADRDEDLQ